MGLSDYITLIRFKYHVTFISVILVSVLAAGMSVSLIKELIILYISFNIMLYGGLYTINGLVDRESDANHPIKKHRPLPSRRITPESALAFSAIMIISSLIIAYFHFNLKMLFIFALFIITNLIYTFIARNIMYLDALTNMLTHSLRVIMGFVLVSAPIHPLFVISYSLMALGYVTVNRASQQDIKAWNSRSTLRNYTKKKMVIIQMFSFAAILFIFICDNSVYKLWHLWVIAAYVIGVFGTHFSKHIKSFVGGMFTSK